MDLFFHVSRTAEWHHESENQRAIEWIKRPSLQHDSPHNEATREELQVLCEMIISRLPDRDTGPANYVPINDRIMAMLRARAYGTPSVPFQFSDEVSCSLAKSLLLFQNMELFLHACQRCSGKNKIPIPIFENLGTVVLSHNQGLLKAL